MQVHEIIIISIGLAMDAFAVSVSAGITTRQSLIRTALLASAVFGGCQ